MDYISISNGIVDNFIVAEPAAIDGLQVALDCVLLPYDEWPTADRGDQYIDGVLYRNIDGVLTDIRLIQPPEPLPIEPDPLVSRVEALEEAVDLLVLEKIMGGNE